MRKYILVLLFAIASLNAGVAQVTIGSLNPPADFSALQLEGTNGGLRLPQVSQTNENLIGVSSPKATGLILYNTNTNWVDYWNGLRWSPVPGELTARNGLRVDGSTVKLGGSLIKNTTINLNGKSLNFSANPGTFRINSNVLQITNRNVTLQPAKFSVNTNNFSVTGGNISAAPSAGTGTVTVTQSASNKVTVNNQNVRVDGPMTYVDGRQANGRVLVASPTGVAHWADLIPNSAIVNGVLSGSNIGINTGSSSLGNPVNITTTELVLTPGKWIIFVNFLVTAGSGSRRYIWLYLYSGPSASETLVTMSGTPPSLTSPYQAYPTMTYLVDVTTTTNFRLKCGTMNSANYTASSSNIFKAIQIVESE